MKGYDVLVIFLPNQDFWRKLSISGYDTDATTACRLQLRESPPSLFPSIYCYAHESQLILGAVRTFHGPLALLSAAGA